MSTPTRLEILALTGIGEIDASTSLAAVLVEAAHRCAGGLAPGDVLVVSSKIVSKAEGRSVPGTDRQAAIDAETVRVVAERRTPRGPARIVQGRSGLVLAAAGVDTSNVSPGTVLLLPVDGDASARALRTALAEHTGVEIGVIVSDTLGRPWREGQTDVAIGAAGLAVTDDLRGAVDTNGVPMEVTVRAVADELAGAADLVKAKITNVPAALIRGFAPSSSASSAPASARASVSASASADGGAASLSRAPAADWFRLGHVEAVRTALGAPPGTEDVDLVPTPLDDVPSRLTRAVLIALVTEDAKIGLELAGAEAVLSAPAEDPAGLIALGAVAQRVTTAAWAESLTVLSTLLPGPPTRLHLTATPHP